MLSFLLRRRVAAAERTMDVPLDYMHHLVEVAPVAALKFSLVTPMAYHRKALPVTAFHVAHLAASRAEDCGTCVQIAVNQARREGVPSSMIQAVLDGRPDDLPPMLADVYHFARAVLAGADAADELYTLRERVRAHYGEEALAELALKLATARVFPAVKRTLGYADRCLRVEVPA